MGGLIVPGALSDSGERCVIRLVELQKADVPTPQVVTPIVTAVEVHVSAMLARLIVLSDIDATPFGAELLSRVEQGLTRTWNDRFTWLHRAFGVTLKGSFSAQQFVTLVEVRNAIVHGDGQLSDEQQRRKITELIALRRNMRKHLNVNAYGRLSFGVDAREHAFAIARSFVQHADQEILKQYPLARAL